MHREGIEPPNGLPELIYSQPPLATWIPVRVTWILKLNQPKADDGSRTHNHSFTKRVLRRLSYVGKRKKYADLLARRDYTSLF